MRPGIKLRIKKAFTENIGLKILAIIFSIGLWLVVVNVDDPSQTRTFSAPVTVINEEVLTEAGRYYTIPDGNNLVKFRVTARRSIIEQLSNTDFIATADMTLLENDSRIPVAITMKNTYAGVSISAKKLYLNVVVGNEIMMKQEVIVETQGELADGCMVEGTSVDPASVAITGPQEVLNRIERVAVYVDVTDANQDVEAMDAMLHFLDNQGKEVDRSRLKIDKDTANVKVSVARVKQVDINVSTSGELPEGLYLDSVTVSPQKISIMGKAEVLNDITAITIPDSVVDLSQIQTSTSTTVDLNQYLPEGVSIATGNNAQAEITIKVSGDMKKTVEIPTANITARNLGENLGISFAKETVSVEIKGNREALAALDAKSITGYVDATGLGAGEHVLPLNLELTEEFSAAPVTVTVTIK